ncbi:methionyl-tRNA formyltransferase [Anoxynatronum sibiricum]|uniref:Methionyl-tRNA formyltransferase n=1 Tax=Anoxynatronum sibiricum TaxID=210623 RepID=A0ABU9VQQ1_9CLOT
MRTVFMGTPAFAVPCLEVLSTVPEIQLQGVYTQPDRPKGRGYHTSPTPVKAKALDLDLPVFQPESSKDEKFRSTLASWRPEVIVVVAYGLLLPADVIHLPAYGCINVHASLLPFYRGAAPIQQCLIDGCLETGITTMLMDEGMDTGPMLLQKSIVIHEDETAQTLHDRLSVIGAETLRETMISCINQSLDPKPQDHSSATYAPRLTKHAGLINWSASASSIDCLIRGTQPWPTAYTQWNGKTLKIWEASVLSGTSVLPSGTVEQVSSEGMVIATGEDRLLVKDVQLEGKKRMAVCDFLHGHTIKPKTQFGV